MVSGRGGLQTRLDAATMYNDFGMESPMRPPMDGVLTADREYLDHGARAVWVVDPDAHAVTVHGSDGPPQTVREPEWLNGGLVLPGFRCSLAQIFKGLG